MRSFQLPSTFNAKRLGLALCSVLTQEAGPMSFIPVKGLWRVHVEKSPYRTPKYFTVSECFFVLSGAPIQEVAI